MEDKNKHEQMPISTEIPAGGDRENTDVPDANKTLVIAGKKKGRAGKKQSAERKSDETPSEHPASTQSSRKAKQKKKSQQMRTKTTCDRSTQTEAPEHQASQTPSPQCSHIKPTESKSTQTKSSKLTFKQMCEAAARAGQDQAVSPDQSKDPHKLTVLTWNIDGLDTENLRERIPGLLTYLEKYRADVVLLQELVPLYLKILQEIITDYEFVLGNDDGYFSGILLRKCRVELLQSNIVKYPTTEMGRNLLLADVNFSDHQFCLMTSHMESMKASSQERLNQLRRVWKRMKEAPDGQTVIFGGDTNLRDSEVKKLGGLPDGISDVWEMLGEPEDCKFTWDTVHNDNKDLPFTAQLRFDRVYLRKAREGAQLRPDTMTLVGMERLACECFISDHWGILCTFSFQASEE